MRGSASLFLILAVVLTLFAAGCGGSSSTGSFAIPATVALVPGVNVSLDLGKTQTLTVLITDRNGKSLVEPVTFSSSNSAVATVSSNGTICAGSWNSLTSPQICTPGPTGTALITASAQGVTSPPLTIYVHQHVDSVVASLLPTQPPSTAPCVSKGLTANYQAHAFSGGTDITNTVGPFTWNPLNVQVVTLNPNALGLLSGQVQATGNVPGTTKIFASIGGTNSVPIDFVTCPVQSISISVSGTLDSSGSGTLVPTVVDSQGVTITGVPISWCSSNRSSVSVGGSGNCNTTDSGTLALVGGGNGGSAAITAACTPDSCNIGFRPSLPIYSKNVVVAATTQSSSVAPTANVWVTSTGCGTTDGCFTTVFPISTPTDTVGVPILLPATPNSLLFNSAGTMAFLGTDQGLQGTRGLAELTTSTTPASVAQFTSVTGKVLAVSGDGTKVIVSDTVASPNQVYVFDTGTSTATTFPITGATAADFSPDSLKAFIVAGNKLYIYSKIDALQTVTLSAPAADVSFLPEGAFAYLAGGAPAALSTAYRTCDNSLADTVSLANATPTIIRALTNSTQVLAVASPNVSLFNVTTSPTGCPPSVTNDQPKSFNLGQGQFTAKQLLLDSNGNRAYIVPNTSSSILVFDITAQTSSAIALAGSGVTALSATLNASGTSLYVAASDGLIHVLDTQVNSDVKQITLPNSICVGGGTITFPCTPDLIAFQP
ncbi:MAG: Ig-like domain-containing protein [Acidobacteriales bacterium]|nr:Ig-like domain-containing protein [Terriglobales bacterium]